MIKNNHIIVEITDPCLASAAELARKMARRGCFLKFGPRTIFSQVTSDFLFSKSYDDMMEKIVNVDSIKKSCRKRFFFETEGLIDPVQIINTCERLKPQVMSVDSALWEKFFPYRHKRQSPVPVFGSFDPHLAHNDDGDDMRVVVNLAEKLLQNHGANGIICNTLAEGMAVRRKDFDGLEVICRLDTYNMMSITNTIKEAFKDGIDAFILGERFARNNRIMDALGREFFLAINELKYARR